MWRLIARAQRGVDHVARLVRRVAFLRLVRGADESIAPAWCGQYQAAIGAKCLAQRREMDLQVVLFNNGVRPDLPNQLVLSDHATAGGDEDLQYVKSARPQAQHLRARAKHAPLKIYFQSTN